MDDNRPLLLLSSCLWIAPDLYYVRKRGHCHATPASSE
jgi:hypothetical protein